MPDWIILLLAFPFICALIGYGTNVLAVKMIFRPHNKFRIMGITFQGVLPKHQRHFARLLAKIIVREFVTTEDLVRGLSRPAVLDSLEEALRPLVSQVVDAIRPTLAEDKQALLNPATVNMVVDQVVTQLRQQAPEIVEALAVHANEHLNLKDVVTEKVVQLGPDGLERIIYEVSKRELDFIEYYGGIFGFMLGLFQYLVLQILGNMALPVVGALVGTVTNWLAIQMLFYPREPTRYLGLFEYQGLFPKRQAEMAQRMGGIAARELIIPSEVFDELMQGSLPETVTEAHVVALEEQARTRMAPVMQMVDSMVDEEARPAMRQSLAARINEEVPRMRRTLVQRVSDHIDLEGMLSRRLVNLKSSEFEQLIRGLFQREEIYLIIYGGLLGGVIGGLQLLVVNWLEVSG